MARRLWELGAARPGSDRVFTSPHGQPLATGTCAAGCSCRRAEAGRAALGDPFHTFRHTCASLLFEAGRDVKQVSAWLGHADPGLTLRTYVHLMDEGVGDAAFMDEAVRWATPGQHEARKQPQAR